MVGKKDKFDVSMIRHKKIITQQTGQYYCYGEQGPATHTHWIAFHGYGQKASRLVSKFQTFSPNEHFVVSPEGLHRFYWEGVTGDVVSSWMTKENRYDDIADYVSFINGVDTASGYSRKKNVKKIAFGFSQGCATLWRWLFNTRPDIDDIVFWAGWLPEDMLFHQHLDYLQTKRLYFVYGDQDEYLTQARLDVLFDRFDSEQLNIKKISFKGTHRVDRQVLQNLYDRELSI